MAYQSTILQVKHKFYSMLMLLALAWLTVSLPFVYADQQAQKAATQLSENRPAADDSNPLANTTEERTESGTNTLSEYLHETHSTEQTGNLVLKSYKLHPSDLYVAFHPEFICPPPDGFAS